MTSQIIKEINPNVEIETYSGHKLPPVPVIEVRYKKTRNDFKKTYKREFDSLPRRFYDENGTLWQRQLTQFIYRGRMCERASLIPVTTTADIKNKEVLSEASI